MMRRFTEVIVTALLALSASSTLDVDDDDVCAGGDHLWRRAHCLDLGTYRLDPNNAVVVDHGGNASFSSYSDGVWVVDDDADRAGGSSGWQYSLGGASAECAFHPLTLGFLLRVARATRRGGDGGGDGGGHGGGGGGGDGPLKLVFVGDSLLNTQVRTQVERSRSRPKSKKSQPRRVWAPSHRFTTLLLTAHHAPRRRCTA